MSRARDTPPFSVDLFGGGNTLCSADRRLIDHNSVSGGMLNCSQDATFTPGEYQ